MKKRTRNTLICKLTGKERITNNSYLGRRLEAIGLDKSDPKSLEYFRHHYAIETEVAKLRQVILTEGFEEARQRWPVSSRYKEFWLLRVALMNGKNKLFKSACNAKWPEMITGMVG